MTPPCVFVCTYIMAWFLYVYYYGMHIYSEMADTTALWALLRHQNPLWDVMYSAEGIKFQAEFSGSPIRKDVFFKRVSGEFLSKNHWGAIKIRSLHII